MSPVRRNTVAHGERRGSERFPLERDLEYRVLGRRVGPDPGAGKTLNMSSSGVLFTAAEVLLPGRRVEVSVSWPAQLNSKCALKFVARGRVVRFDDGHVAVEIQQHEFRTHSAKSHEAAASK